jgi:hypothetical protein
LCERAVRIKLERKDIIGSDIAAAGKLRESSLFSGAAAELGRRPIVVGIF